MSSTQIFALFLAYSVLGWLIDTSKRSFDDRRLVPGGFSKYPICPSYGVGAFLALGLSPALFPLPLWLQGVALGIVLSGYEYAAGVISERLFGRKLWDYSKNPWSFNGHTDLTHALYWGLLGLLLIHKLHPFMLEHL